MPKRIIATFIILAATLHIWTWADSLMNAADTLQFASGMALLLATLCTASALLIKVWRRYVVNKVVNPHKEKSCTCSEHERL